MDETAIWNSLTAKRTINRKGRNNSIVGSNGKGYTRYTLTLAVNKNGKKAPPMIIHKSLSEKLLNKIMEKSYKVKGNDSKLFIAHGKKSTMSEKIMLFWLEKVFYPICRPGKATLLFMDNVSSHCTERVKAWMKERCIVPFYLPANTTPQTQPLDHSINSTVKQLWTRESQYYYVTEGYKQLTKKGNKKAVGKEIINLWCATVTEEIKSTQIINSWNHVLCGSTIQMKSQHLIDQHRNNKIEEKEVDLVVRNEEERRKRVADYIAERKFENQEKKAEERVADFLNLMKLAHRYPFRKQEQKV